MNITGFVIGTLCIAICLSSCSSQRQISKTASHHLIRDSNLIHAHIGISVYDPSLNKYLYEYQSDKYFVPASNTKIFSCYAAMKNLGDSIVGIRYREDDTAIYLFPSGDPTLLHQDFSKHPVIEFLQKTRKAIYITDQFWKTEPYGSGWSWNDYNSSYMAERSPLPVYGNYIRWIQERVSEPNTDSMQFDQSVSIYSVPEVNWRVRFNPDPTKKNFSVQRDKNENVFVITQSDERRQEVETPFVTNGLRSATELLKDTIYKEIGIRQYANGPTAGSEMPLKVVYSHPLDSVLAPMMHRSDNFFAEQLLLMVANERSGVMNEDSTIDAMLGGSLGDLPQKPRWVDGSGLSRYNLFTPLGFISILNKMRQEFTMERLKLIFPTAREGTLVSYPKSDSGYLFAKTGTLSGVVALSGFLYTEKGKLLIFSILVNNHRTTSTVVRSRIQSFISTIRRRY